MLKKKKNSTQWNLWRILDFKCLYIFYFYFTCVWFSKKL